MTKEDDREWAEIEKEIQTIAVPRAVSHEQQPGKARVLRDFDHEKAR